MIRYRFNDGWEYTEGAPFLGVLLTPTQPVTIPHDASIGKPRRQEHLSGPGGGYAWNGVVTYRKRFQAPTGWQGQRVQLEFEGVMMHAEVFVNRQFLAAHPYGYTSFLVDLTPHLQYGTDNEVVVVANNSAQPNSRWYTGTGLYRHVWLRIGGALHIPPWGVFVTTPGIDPASSTVVVATEIANTTPASAAAILRTAVLASTGVVLAQVEALVAVATGDTGTTNQTLTIADAQLWSVDSPYLYTLQSEVLVDGAVVDREITTFGIRSITVEPSNGFQLNGVPLKLKGGNIHHDHGLLGAASYERAEERKVELMKSAGFNALRCAHNPPAPALLDACDRLGMLVIDESFDMWRVAKSVNDYHLYFEAWWQRDTAAMVKRDRNHPSVIMWSIGNEIPEAQSQADAADWSHGQADLIRSLDPTRLVTQGLLAPMDEFFSLAAQGAFNAIFETMTNKPAPTPDNDHWGKLTKTFADPLEVVGYNYQPHRYAYDQEHFPDRVICGTESYPHQAFVVWEATLCSPTVIGDFVWAAIDYLGEAGIGKVAIGKPLPGVPTPYPYHLANCGDFDICGFKRPQSVFRDILWGVRTAPFIGVLNPQFQGQTIHFSPWGWEPVIESWTFPGSEGMTTRVDVYSADEEVELLLNGVSLSRKPAGTVAQNKVSFEVAYAPGTLEAVGYRGGQVTGRTRLSTAGAAVALRLTPDRATISATASDLSYVTVEVVDAEGAVVRHATHQVRLDVSGMGKLLAIGTANPVSEELYLGTERAAYEGRLMAVVQSTGQAGTIHIRAMAEGLAPVDLRLAAEEQCGACG